MVELERGSIIRKYDSEIEVPQKGNFLGGTLKKGGIGRYFLRQNQRYTEVFAGNFGKDYGLGMDGEILQDLLDKDCDYIFIATQYNIWEITLSEFIANMKSHGGMRGIYVCSTDDFVKHEIADTLPDLRGKVPPSERNYNNDKETRKKADEINKKAEENANKAKKGKQLGKTNVGKTKVKDKNYKEGEQIGLF